MLDGDPAPLPKRAEPPIFDPCLYCDQTAGWIKMALGMAVGLGTGDTVLDGHPAAPPPRRDSPPISAHDCCGQTAGWVKMPLGTEVGLHPGEATLC